VLPPQALLPPPRAVPGPPDEEDLPDAEKNYFYITKVDLQLKGASLDALHHPQTYDNCQDDFFKMLYSNVSRKNDILLNNNYFNSCIINRAILVPAHHVDSLKTSLRKAPI
jgi:hypothetical protein